MSALTAVEDAIRGIAADLHAQADTLLTGHAPVIHDAADTITKLTTSRIVTELMQYGEEYLPSSTVDAVVALIRDSGEAAAKIAQLSAPPPPPPVQEPVQDQPQ